MIFLRILLTRGSDDLGEEEAAGSEADGDDVFILGIGAVGLHGAEVFSRIEGHDELAGGEGAENFAFCDGVGDAAVVGEEHMVPAVFGAGKLFHRAAFDRAGEMFFDDGIDQTDVCRNDLVRVFCAEVGV